MQVCVFTEPHRGASYDTQLRFARQVEECGFAGFFRADHYQQFGSSDGLPGPTDAWVTLAGLARETSRIRLGTLVTCATFRLPGPLAIIVAQVDQMSGGRVELGIGAGWFAREHASYGIPFPPTGERVSRMAEQLEVITGLWRTPVGETFTHSGEFYQLVEAPALPKPVQRPYPPVIVGGKGAQRTPAVAARHADEYNAVFLAPDAAGEQFTRVRQACERIGRDPDTRPIRMSAGIPLACGRTEAEARRRAEALYEADSALPPGEAPLVGTPGEVVERIGEYSQVGAERVYLRLADMTDLDQLELIAAEVLPKLG
jgi:F420-dependent oxidoreductase-like protein